MNSQKLRDIIEKSLGENSKALIESSDDVHFKASIISPRFLKIGSELQRQKLIYRSINEHITSGQVHAISMKTYTPDQWETLHNNG